MLCHDPARKTVLGYPDYPLPSLADAIDMALRLGARTNPAIRCAGVSLNTSRLDEHQARRLIDETAALGLPAADPIRGGKSFDRLVEACLTDLTLAANDFPPATAGLKRRRRGGDGCQR